MMFFARKKGNDKEKENVDDKKKGKKRYIYFLFTIPLLICIIFISIMNSFGNDKWKIYFEVFSSIFELLYFSSGIVLIIGLYIGYKQLEISNKDNRDRNERLAVEKSMEYLNFFSATLLPKMNIFLQEIQGDQPIKIKGWIPKENDFLLKMDNLGEIAGQAQELKILEKLVLRERNGLQDIFNQLEFFSAGINHGLGKEDVVYRPISKVFCKFIEQEIIPLCLLRGNEAPFENLLSLYQRWDQRLNNETTLLQLQEETRKIEETRRKIASTEEFTKPKKHIGES